MIRTRIYIKRYDWLVTCYIAVTHYATEDILEDLRSIGCRGKNYQDAEAKLRKGEVNAGMTYTSYRNMESVMVTSIADSAAEQMNTITHEIAHVCAHIAYAMDIDMASEEYAYMVGDVSMAIFPKVNHLLCERCRKNNHNCGDSK